METLLIDSVKKLARATQPALKRDLHKALRDGLVKLMKDPNESMVLKYFDFLSWADAKVDGTTYAEVVRAKLKR